MLPEESCSSSAIRNTIDQRPLDIIGGGMLIADRSGKYSVPTSLNMAFKQQDIF